MDILAYTKTRSNELADYLDECARSPLVFDGNDPLMHSSDNHIHLWNLEYFAERNEWIDLKYKHEFVTYILDAWKNRIKGLAPYQTQGYRMYVYSDMAPTISVVAETEIGFPYRNSLDNAVYVNELLSVLEHYEGRKWSHNFGGEWDLTHERVLNTVASNKGSISKPTANMLGLKVGELRHLIINMGLSRKVNDIRKKFKRRPADFSHNVDDDYQMLFYEILLPPKFS
ncbi:hypothetical protein [Motilimonas eburnea]|uniref:hypothetical protein n=1 Tax=Motilimonas eburnea TaxID=1737488 RepID=UPI001E57826F|nr:hypothetical protein [Motilimonas eburnea]MCE2573879.1 hypothetical protein [Motilimonas eburnea]